MHPLFLASSVFPWCPSPCPLHYRKAFDYYDTAALSPACWHSRIPFRVKRFQSSLIPTENVVVPLSCLLYAGWSSETVLHAGLVMKATTLPFLVMASQPVSPCPVDDAKVPGFSRQHRAQDSLPFCILARRSDSLSVGFPPQEMPFLDAGHSILMSLLKHDPQ